jgi:hypothetical protein
VEESNEYRAENGRKAEVEAQRVPILIRGSSDPEFQRGSKSYRAAGVVLPGYSRPLIRARDFIALLDESTYDGVRVR